MPLIVIPFVAFASALFLLNFKSHSRFSRISGWVSVLSGSLFFLLVLAAGYMRLSPVEYQFSPLFNLPGMPETLTFSLYLDVVSREWLLWLAVVSLCIYGLELADPNRSFAGQLESIHLAQAGLATFFLSGSLISGSVGWGITLAAILFTFRKNTSVESRDSSSFTILMISVFLLLTASFLVYAVVGRLSYSNSPESLALLLKTLLNAPVNPVVMNLLNFISLVLLFAIIPGLALVPFSSWLAETRHINAVNALFIYIIVMPAGTILLQRYAWLFAFSPVAKYTALTICSVSVAMAYTAVFSQKENRSTMLWLAIICTALLCGSHFISGHQTISLLLKTLYPGLFLFGIGRVLQYEYHVRFGRYLEFTGVFLPALLAIGFSLAFRPLLENNIGIILISSLIYLLPALRIYRSSVTATSLDELIPSSLGWSAYHFFGADTVIQKCIIIPLEQLADGFLLLESYLNLFLTHGLAGIIRKWGRLLWLFDTWFIDGGLKWLKRDRTSVENISINHHDKVIVLLLVLTGALHIVIRKVIA